MKLKIILKLLMLLPMLMGSVIFAQSFQCVSGNDIRLIEVVYDNPPAQVPCSVHYTKWGHQIFYLKL
jgi:hypothetical protein